MFFMHNKIEIKDSPGMDRGVFATDDIQKGEKLEVAPILILQFSDFIDTKWNLLFEYYFWLDECVVLALGWASMYNHRIPPNAKYKIDLKKRTITFSAIKDIKKGEGIDSNNYTQTELSHASIPTTPTRHTQDEYGLRTRRTSRHLGWLSFFFFFLVIYIIN